MKLSSLLGVGAAVVGFAQVAALASSTFVATLSGPNERPLPVDSPALGFAIATLDGGPGAYTLSYQIIYSGLTSEVVGGHIHVGINPPGSNPEDQTGPIVHELDSLGSPISGEWSSADSSNALSDLLVDSLFDGELYINIHTSNFPAGEIRGNLNLSDGGPINPIPLPAPLAMGALGLALALPMGRRVLRK